MDKKCKGCGQTKVLDEFHRHSETKDSRRHKCKTCVSKIEHDRYAKLLPKAKRARINRNVEWQKNNHASVLASGRKYKRKWAYGLYDDKYQAMLRSQNSSCAICGKHETASRKGTLMQLCVDHDHDTGKIRELLCMRCNRALGLLRDDPAILDKAAAYLRKHRQT